MLDSLRREHGLDSRTDRIADRAERRNEASSECRRVTGPHAAEVIVVGKNPEGARLAGFEP